jgi:D-alanine-D-alanine ligase
MKVALTYNLKKDAAKQGLPLDYYSECDSTETIGYICDAIKAGGNSVYPVEAADNIIEKLMSIAPDMVFNIAEGSSGTSRESQIPAILEYLNMPFTGSGALANALSLNKSLAKMLFIKHRIPTPKFQVFSKNNNTLKRNLTFPLIVKPNSEGSAKGITKESVVYNKQSLYEQIDAVRSTYSQDILIEEFIGGKELTVGILGNENLYELPIMEIDFSECRNSGEYFYSWRMKEYQGDEKLGLTPSFHCPAEIEKDVAQKVKQTACKAYRLIGCSDFARVDIRLSRDNVPYVLEINTLPGLDPKESNFPMIARHAGIEYNRLIGIILELAVDRYNEKSIGDQSFSAMQDSMTFIRPRKHSYKTKSEGEKYGI